MCGCIASPHRTRMREWVKLISVAVEVEKALTAKSEGRGGILRGGDSNSTELRGGGWNWMKRERVGGLFQKKTYTGGQKGPFSLKVPIFYHKKRERRKIDFVSFVLASLCKKSIWSLICVILCPLFLLTDLRNWERGFICKTLTLVNLIVEDNSVILVIKHGVCSFVLYGILVTGGMYNWYLK